MSAAPTTIEEILAADPGALGRLATSDYETWETLARHIYGNDACPAPLVHALLAIDDPTGWASRLFAAYRGKNPDLGMGADWDFRRWFGAGIVNTLAKEDIVSLRVRYTTATNDVEDGAASRVAALVADIEAANGGADHRALLGRALLLLARRLGEQDDHDAAIAAAVRAEDVFTTLGDAAWSAQAVRMRAAALLRQRKIDEALALLDTAAAAPNTYFSSEGSYRGIRAVQNPDGTYRAEKVLDAIDTALDHAAAIALWAATSDSDWIIALGKIAKATGHPGCAARAGIRET